jgi:hypothetical protein
VPTKPAPTIAILTLPSFLINQTTSKSQKKNKPQQLNLSLSGIRNLIVEELSKLMTIFTVVAASSGLIVFLLSLEVGVVDI